MSELLAWMDAADEAERTRRHARDDAIGSDDADRANTRPTQRECRPKRKRSYDEVKRRRMRANTGVAAYMERGRQGRVGAKRNAIEMGALALDRVVAQCYEWRDAGLGRTGRGWAYG